MHIVLVGVSHKTAPIEVRERLAFRHERLPEVFARLRAEIGLQEALILSTCNRVEIYAGLLELDGTVERLKQFLSDHGALPYEGLSSRLYSFTEPESVRHLFCVASGLDSMVFGEAEILHQVKRAYELARQHGAVGKVFNVLCQRALNAAKAVRTETAIGSGGMSIGTVAVELARKIFGSLADETVLLVGAGKIGEVTLKRLSARGVSRVRVMNRSLKRAEQLALAFGGIAVGLDRLLDELVGADIAILSTSASRFLLRRHDVADAMRTRRQRPLCLIDLGVPRNIEPEVGRLENVYLFDVDDLQGLVDHHHEKRLLAITQSQAILQAKVERFLAWWQEEQATCARWSSAPAAAR